jgi:hypothetical protein
MTEDVPNHMHPFIRARIHNQTPAPINHKAIAAANTTPPVVEAANLVALAAGIANLFKK